jgi:hypothetical protein
MLVRIKYCIHWVQARQEVMFSLTDVQFDFVALRPLDRKQLNVSRRHGIRKTHPREAKTRSKRRAAAAMGKRKRPRRIEAARCLERSRQLIVRLTLPLAVVEPEVPVMGNWAVPVTVMFSAPDWETEVLASPR